MNSWTGDTEDNGDEGSTGFEATLQDHVDRGATTDIDELELMEGVEEVEDVGLLKQAYRQLEGSGHEEKTTLVKKQLHALDSAVPEGDTEQGSLEDVDDDEPPTGSSQEPDEVEETEEPEPSQPEPEPASEVEDQDAGLNEESDESQSSSLSEPESGGPPEPASASDPSEVQNRERRWKVLVWGPPGLFKSHFAWTAPEPIAYIDLENKAHDIAHKFEDREARVWQPAEMDQDKTRFERATQALNEALEWLQWWYDEKDIRGTLVVDSISKVWEWAQWHHKLQAYPMTDPEDVSLEIGDWNEIKDYHNGDFRTPIVESPFHFVWTAWEKDDVQTALSDDEDTRENPKKAAGEKYNTHSADTIIRARKDGEGVKVGDMTKSNFTDRLFRGLDQPTFPKVVNAVEALEEAEATDEEVDRRTLEEEMGVERVIRQDPRYYDGN